MNIFQVEVGNSESFGNYFTLGQANNNFGRELVKDTSFIIDCRRTLRQVNLDNKLHNVFFIQLVF